MEENFVISLENKHFAVLILRFVCYFVFVLRYFAFMDGGVIFAMGLWLLAHEQRLHGITYAAMHMW